MKAPLMIKWRYWNNSTAKAGRASNYLNYIGTRDGVEKLTEEKIIGYKQLLSRGNENRKCGNLRIHIFSFGT